MYVSIAQKWDPPANQWDNLVFGFLAIETHTTHFISVKSINNEKIEFRLFGIPVLPGPPYTDKNRRDISLSIIIKNLILALGNELRTRIVKTSFVLSAR